MDVEAHGNYLMLTLAVALSAALRLGIRKFMGVLRVTNRARLRVALRGVDREVPCPALCGVVRGRGVKEGMATPQEEWIRVM